MHLDPAGHVPGVPNWPTANNATPMSGNQYLAKKDFSGTGCLGRPVTGSAGGAAAVTAGLRVERCAVRGSYGRAYLDILPGRRIWTLRMDVDVGR
jgi:hypothetical protein